MVGAVPLTIKRNKGDMILCYEVLPFGFKFPKDEKEFTSDPNNIVVLSKMVKNVERQFNGIFADAKGYLAHEATHILDLQHSSSEYNEGADFMSENFRENNIFEINAFLMK